MAYNQWDRYIIWLHKQPLFLWQIALSFKIFGVSEFSLRLPDIILGSVLIFATYRSGKLLVNQRVGYLAGVLFLSTLYFTELVAGRQEVDHNDFIFMVYVSLSLWALIEYNFSRRVIWIYFIGIFSGMAILCKWLVGLLVYLGWFILNLLKKKFKISDYKAMIVALSITIIIALPWQILTFLWYPAEAGKALMLNRSHFWIAIEEHQGSFLYHFEKFNLIYGMLIFLLIIPSFFLLFKKAQDKQMVPSAICMVVFVYLFFSFAASKMLSFTIVASMIILIAFAVLIESVWLYLCRWTSSSAVRNLIFGALVILIVVLRFDIGQLREKHLPANPDNLYSQMLIHNKAVFLSLHLPGNAVLFNVKGRHYIEAMFYTGMPAYNFLPTFQQYQDLIAKGRCVAIIRPENSKLPAYLINDTTTIIIDQIIKGYE
jgi:4-amino-4-deoxy-L-arabinose transferase-like glycosyltransferase